MPATRFRNGLGWLVPSLVLASLWIAWLRCEHASRRDFLVFDRSAAFFCPIVVPAQATAPEREAAALLAETLARAAERPTQAFPIVTERRDWRSPRGIHVGATRAAQALTMPDANLLDRTVVSRVTPAGLVLRAAHPEDTVCAASWWLEKELGAHWFIPGSLGVAVAPRDRLRLPFGTDVFTPGFASRSLGGDANWGRQNRLQRVFSHGHSMSALFRREDLQREQDLAPMIEGRKFLPAPGDSNWQPNLISPKAVAHAVERGREYFRANAGARTFAVCMNDSIHYDQSPDTMRQIEPLRYFRGRPDYSRLVFQFVNSVARELGREFPERFVSTYAYDWNEQIPDFPIEPNVVPFLTADRLMYFDRRFAQEDMNLIARWTKNGPRTVGLYDYYEGAPFVIPRLATAAIAESIVQAHKAGVRAFYAEGDPHWGLDGPKHWLAAQLLWNPQQDPASLLDTYYREFWREAAPPMREYFVLCEQAWTTQPLPTYWLKYYKDDHQHLLFPKNRRTQMRALLASAQAQTVSEVTRQRVELVRTAWGVTEAFCDFCEERDAASRLALKPVLDPAAAVAALENYATRRTALQTVYERQQRLAPLAVARLPWDEYLRNDPCGRLVRRLAQTQPSALIDDRLQPLLRATWGIERAQVLRSAGSELAMDSALAGVRLKTTFDSSTLEYTSAGAWNGRGEPFETRAIELRARAAGQGIRFGGCKQDSLFQWRQAVPGALYAATAQVRARVSPGNRTFLIVSFLDAKGNYMGVGSIDRLPVGNWNDRDNELCVLARAPQMSAQIGIGVRVLDQVDADFAEFAEISLRRLE
ncbi:MAG: DUF4838 domain-containing protein [Opitutaceae bacterium]|nr:DUF4838 domain-containing protein [Opitutaceae bacterium]